MAPAWPPENGRHTCLATGGVADHHISLFPPVLFRIIEHLGAGQFGTVNKGLWQSPDGTMEVAVKTLQPNASEMDKVKFLQEAAIMGQFLHPDVVKLHGVVTVGQPVSELMLSVYPLPLLA